VKKVAIMTDTLSELTTEIADEYSIKLVPVTIIIDGKEYPETEIDRDWYYEQLPKWKAADKVPTSSSASIGYFLQSYRELSQQAEAILCITYSSKFGMMFSTATQAKKMAEEELPRTAIEVVDSLTVCSAQMLIAIEAARAAAAGKSLPEVAEVANKMVKKVNNISLIDDLSLLAKGGRIHKVRPWAGSKVTNTVLIEANAATGGEHRPVARCKTKGQALKALFDVVKERSGNGKLHVAINHADALVEAEELKEIASSRFSCAEVFITPLYPLVTHHTGVGARVFNWWSED
jgi:DegV family protein with EDD domain